MSLPFTAHWPQMVTLAPASHEGARKYNLITCLEERTGNIWQTALMIPGGLREEQIFHSERQGRG